jgi:TFIIF-interacting CTD phosphatase-like protein
MTSMTQTATDKHNTVLLVDDNGATATNNSRSSLTPVLCVEGMTFSAGLAPPTTVEEAGISNSSETMESCSKKRKRLSYEITPMDTGDLSSLPSLASEDDILLLEEQDDRDDGDEGTATATVTTTEDCCHDFESQIKKRRRITTGSSDLIVVLDMDECLIHFGIQEKQEQEQDQQENELSQTASTPTPTSACDEEEDEEDHKTIDATANGDVVVATDHSTFMYVNEHKVLLRPGLIHFLRYVTARFQTHIFTAGTKDYADSILDQLCLLVGDTNAFCKRWYRSDCDTIDILDPLTAFCIDSIYVKPLSKVAEWAGRDAQDLRRIVHVDDQPRNFLLNHGNGIRVAEWRGDNPDDSVLSEVTKVLRKIDTDGFGDVRPHLRNESYKTLKDQLDMLNLFPYRRTKGIWSALL